MEHDKPQIPNRFNRKQSLNKYAKYSSLAFQMIAVFVGFSLGGDWIDKNYQFKFPYFTLLGVLFALVSVFYLLFKLIKEEN